ncbi:MAG: phosphoribosylglycinamide formyltransferase [Ruminococcaceae bacterium]|nr:phosphoribosylglycinamide formyltransferase [Oscillospiraceae bacterium]
MKKVKIAVFVSGGGTNLQAIIDYAEVGKIPHGELALVLSSSPDAYALTRAEMHGIPTEVVPRKMYDTQEKFETAVCKVLEDNSIEMIVLAGFMTILSENFVKKFPRRIINVHPSLIPAFCGKGFYGLKVHSAALEYGVKVTGATVHFVNEVPDGGEIILQKAVTVRKDETPESLQKNVMRHAEWIILPKATEMVAKMIAKGALTVEEAE